MSEHARGDLHDDAAEQLLRDPSAGRGLGADPLAQLLRAAAAPGRPGELTGQAAAMAAFRVARAGATALPRHGVLRRLLAVKVAALAAAITAGGVAVAAGTGVLPNPLRPAPATSSVVPRPSHGPTSPSTSPSTSTAPSPTAGTQGSLPSPAPLPTVGLVGLCRSYLSDPDRGNGKAVAKPAYARLVAAAGGASGIEGYCTNLLAGEAKAVPSAKPSHQYPSRVGPAK